MTPLFKKIELFEGPSNLLSESYCGGRGLLKSAFKDFQIGKNFRFLDVIWRTVGDGLIQRIINAPVIAHLRLHLFSDRHALVIDILQHTDRIIRCESRFARLQRKAELNPQRAESFYGGGAEGYTDYPTL